MAGHGLVFIAYPTPITQMPLPRLLLHFYYGRSLSCFHSLSSKYHTDAVTTNYCYTSFMAGPGLVFIAYQKAITHMPLAPLLLHFFYGRSWPCFHRLSKGYHTDATTTITVTVTLLLWQVRALFSSSIQRLSHRCRYHHY